MHANAILLQRLFTSLNRHDYQAMADCYHPDATFQDIAFDLKGKNQIRAMWQMICSGDIKTTFEVVQADDRDGLVKLIDEYTFTETGRRVRNPIESAFHFRDGLIVEHRDSCDPKSWAAAALGGVAGFLAGRLRFLRASKARCKLRRSIRVHA
jgi:ketosteroid isomerase-like protein